MTIEPTASAERGTVTYHAMMAGALAMAEERLALRERVMEMVVRARLGGDAHEIVSIADQLMNWICSAPDLDQPVNASEIQP